MYIKCVNTKESGKGKHFMPTLLRQDKGKKMRVALTSEICTDNY